jgi:hypothetical protein
MYRSDINIIVFDNKKNNIDNIMLISAYFFVGVFIFNTIYLNHKLITKFTIQSHPPAEVFAVHGGGGGGVSAWLAAASP